MSLWSLTAVVIAAAALGCQPPPGADDLEGESPSMQGFSWVVDDELAAMPRPGSRAEVADDLSFLRDQGIDLLISLTITPIDSDQLDSHGIDGHHIPVEDFTAPTLEQMDEFVALIAERVADGELVGVHCTAGLGRSGTMSAANFVAHGFEPDAAIDEIRRLRPGSIETAAQERSIFDFAETRD